MLINELLIKKLSVYGNMKLFKHDHDAMAQILTSDKKNLTLFDNLKHLALNFTEAFFFGNGITAVLL